MMISRTFMPLSSIVYPLRIGIRQDLINGDDSTNVKI